MLRRILRIGAIRHSERDTDRDWQIIGTDEPYFGVITSAEFKRDKFDDEARRKFFASGQHEVLHHLARMRSLFGPFEPQSALDFGCGVGRLTVPLAQVTGRAIGVDISPGMLAEARRHIVAGLTFVEAIPNDSFEWVMSLIVLQHIPPARGYGILKQLLSRVSDGGGVTIQVMFARTGEHAKSVGTRLIIDGDTVTQSIKPADSNKVPPGIMIMHDYDLSHVIALFYLAGIRSIHLDHCDHGGMIGATIYGRKCPA
jgi:2-polyprenyl-3-methyl-5-hydroxy-6-metoxy-1,4-benzoquinol methylase